jgi:flagellar biosynthesis/type III secretory pathway protein FliH
MTRMQIATRDRVRVRLQCLRLIATLRLDPARSQLIAGFVYSYLRLTEAEFRRFEREQGALSTQERETMLTLTNEWIEVGKEQGIEQGIAQGIERGVAQGLAEGGERGRAAEAREMVLKLGEKRFGPIGPTERATLEAATRATLEALGERLLDMDVTTWKELLGL